MPAEVGLICRPPEVLPPEPALDEAEDDVVVANDLGRDVGEELREEVFQLVLVRDNQVAVRAVAAILAHRDDMSWHDSDGKHELAPPGPPGAARAAARAVMDMRVEGETVAGRKLAESAGRGFSFHHGIADTPNNSTGQRAADSIFDLWFDRPVSHGRDARATMASWHGRLGHGTKLDRFVNFVSTKRT